LFEDHPEDPDSECSCAGFKAPSNQVQLRARRQAPSLFRIRKAAQEFCKAGELEGRTAKGRTAAVYYACEVDGRPLGYCCKDMSAEDAERKTDAPQTLLDALVADSDKVNSDYIKLQTNLEYVSWTLGPLTRALKLLDEQRALVERKESHCRADIDDLQECGDPLYFLLDLRHLYADFSDDIASITSATKACTSLRQILKQQTMFAMTAAKEKGAVLAAKAAKTGRRVVSRIWRNRFLLLAGIVVIRGAQPFVEQLASAGMDKVMAMSLGEMLEQLVIALKSVACDLVSEPMLMAAAVGWATNAMGSAFLASIQKPQRPTEVLVPGDGESLGDVAAAEQKQALKSKARGFASFLREYGAAPVMAEALMVVAGDFLEGIGFAVCAAMGGTPVSAAAPAGAQATGATKARPKAHKAATSGSDSEAATGGFFSAFGGNGEQTTPTTAHANFANRGQTKARTADVTPKSGRALQNKFAKLKISQQPDSTAAVLNVGREVQRGPKASARTAASRAPQVVDSTSATWQRGKMALENKAPARAAPSRAPHVVDSTSATWQRGKMALEKKAPRLEDAEAQTMVGGMVATLNAVRSWWNPKVSGQAAVGGHSPVDSTSALLKAGRKLLRDEDVVPVADANAVAQGAFAGFLLGPNAWAVQDGWPLGLDPDSAWMKGEMLHSSLLEDERAQDSAASEEGDASFVGGIGRSLVELSAELSKELPTAPASLDALGAVLDSARLYLPMLALFAWSAEYLLPSLPFLDAGDDESLGDDSADGTATTSDSTASGTAPGACADGEECELLSLRALKDRSKEAKAKIAEAVEEAIGACQRSSVKHQEPVGAQESGEHDGGHVAKRMQPSSDSA